MGALPFLSVNARARFDVDAAGNLTEPNGFPPKSPLMRPLLPRLMNVVNNISPMAKLDRAGRAQERWAYELPPMEITGMLVNAYHIEGVKPRGQIPFSMKAIGLVDASKIMAGGRGLVSDKFVIVP